MFAKRSIHRWLAAHMSSEFELRDAPAGRVEDYSFLLKVMLRPAAAREPGRAANAWRPPSGHPGAAPQSPPDSFPSLFAPSS
jgi:hypothetical protein